MSEKTDQGQSGGVNISGTVGSVGGDIVGGNKITAAPSRAALDDSPRPVLEAIRAAPLEAQPAAEAKLAALKQEAAKGKDANDDAIGTLVDELVDLVPGSERCGERLCHADPWGHHRSGNKIRAEEAVG
jgi:hypothetical protein